MGYVVFFETNYYFEIISIISFQLGLIIFLCFATARNWYFLHLNKLRKILESTNDYLNVFDTSIRNIKRGFNILTILVTLGLIIYNIKILLNALQFAGHH